MNPSIPRNPTRNTPGPSSGGRWLFAIAAMTVSLGGCRDVDDDEVSGELGVGKFRYLCVGPDDPACPSGSDATSFPSRIGVGGSFDVEFDKFRGRSTPGDFVVRSASPWIIEDSSPLRAAAPGTVALFARKSAQGTVVDFVHVDVAALESLQIELLGDELTPEATGLIVHRMPSGTSASFRAVPIDSEGVTVAGSREFRWSSSDETVAGLLVASPASRMRIEGRAVGSALLRVETGEVEARIEVIVEPGSVPTEAGTPDGGDGGRDSGAPREGGSSDSEAGAGPRDASTDAHPGDAPLDGSPDAAAEGGATDATPGDASIADAGDGAP